MRINFVIKEWITLSKNLNKLEININLKEFLINIQKIYLYVSKKYITIGELFTVFLTAYLFVSVFYMRTIKTTATVLIFVNKIKKSEAIVILLVIMAAILLFRKIFAGKPIVKSTFIGAIYCFGLAVILESVRDVFVVSGVIILVGFFTYAVYKNTDFMDIKIKTKINYTLILVVMLFIISSTILALSTIYRYKTFVSETYDLGIFAQMFEYMKRTGLPYTTCERDMLLSHFAVHFSPIYYLILPGYYVFSCPEYLLAMQAILVCSAVFPVYFLCRHYKLSNLITLLISVIYLAYPGVQIAVFYDFHENKFLPVLILWFIYFLEKKKYVPAYIFLALTLAVKEDAVIYVFFIGVFYLFAKKIIKHGIIIMLIAVIYFVVVSTLMEKYGQGIMSNRFALYFLPNQQNLTDIVKNIIINPTFLIVNLFIPAKINFILFMMGPLLFIPLISKKQINLLLLVPMIIVNLAPNYEFQYNIGFQYTYGVASLLIFLFIFNIKNLSNKWQVIICLVAVFSTLAFMKVAIGNKLSFYSNNYQAESQIFKQTELALAKIPVTSTVTADTYLLPHLYKTHNLYMYRCPYPNKDRIVDTEYYVFNIRDKKYRVNYASLEKRGYKLVFEGGLAKVYKK